MISIYKASSTYEADIIKSVLEDHEIECFIQGYNHRSMLGFVGAYIELDVLVDESDEAKAKELIESIEFEEVSLPEDPKTDPPVSLKLKEESPLQLRNKFMRSFCFAFIFPGAGCSSMGLKEAASWILIGTAICIFLFFAEMGVFVLFALVLLMLTDMILVIREYRRRKHELK